MNRYSARSNQLLNECDHRLRAVFRAVLPQVDHSIICGRRTREEQQKKFDAKLSLAKPGESLHNVDPPGLSLATDAQPYPYDETDQLRWYYFIGTVKATAYSLDIKIRSGADWDNKLPRMHSADLGYKLMDLSHWEVID